MKKLTIKNINILFSFNINKKIILRILHIKLIYNYQ
jgi:hypothetical protein